jgi:hypothetical protein
MLFINQKIIKGGEIIERTRMQSRGTKENSSFNKSHQTNQRNQKD